MTEEAFTPIRKYDERSYIDRTIRTIRQYNRNQLRDDWWTGAALTLADEVDRLKVALTEIRDGYDGDEFEDSSDISERHQSIAARALEEVIRNG